MTAHDKKTERKRKITIQQALKVIINALDARWEYADSEGDSMRCYHLNGMLEDLAEEFGQ